jgi:hypothetical protein
MKNSLFILLLLISTFSFTQNNGFLGKKNFISADVRAYTPMIYGIFTNDDLLYKTDGTSYVPSTNFIDYGFNFSIGRAMSRNVGFIFQYGISNYEFAYNPKIGLIGHPEQLDEDIYGYTHTELNKSNWFKAKSSTFMPIIEMTNGSGLLPLGISHQLGIGFTKHTFVEDNYNIQIFDYSNGTKNYTPTNLFDYQNEFARSFTLMYKLNLRVPITEFLLYNIGIRYNLNLMPSLDLWTNNYNPYSNNGGYLISQDQFREMVKNKELSNIMSFETGFSICF